MLYNSKKTYLSIDLHQLGHYVEYASTKFDVEEFELILDFEYFFDRNAMIIFVKFNYEI